MNESLISAWQVYLVMQLDAVHSVLSMLCTLTGGAIAIAAITGGMLKADSWKDSNDYKSGESIHGYIPKLLPAFIAMIVLGAILPTSRTAAAMYVLPMLTSNAVTEPASREFKELLDLTKGALKNLGLDEPTPAVEKEK